MLATGQQPTGSGHLALARRAIGIEGGEHSRCSPPHLRNAEKSSLSHPMSARDTGPKPSCRDWPSWHFDLAVLVGPTYEVSRASRLLVGRLADVGVALALASRREPFWS